MAANHHGPSFMRDAGSGRSQHGIGQRIRITSDYGVDAVRLGDEHVNNVVFSGIEENRPRTHVYSFQFEEVVEGHELARRAQRQRNLIVVGPKTGMIGGRRTEWKLDDPAPVTDVAFELAPATEASPKPTNGQMKLGDFAYFCQFLRSMSDR